jgi:hypothetical protein
MLAPDVISPDLAIGAGILLTALALWLWRPRRRVIRMLCLECRQHATAPTLESGLDWLTDHGCNPAPTERSGSTE